MIKGSSCSNQQGDGSNCTTDTCDQYGECTIFIDNGSCYCGNFVVESYKNESCDWGANPDQVRSMSIYFFK